jgi:glycerol-3-phosphate dehydrogenase
MTNQMTEESYVEQCKEAIETAKMLGSKNPIFNVVADMLEKDLDLSGALRAIKQNKEIEK